MEALRGGLRDLGYVEGQQIGIIDRLAEEKSHRLPDLAAELVRLKVDVIVTAGPVSTRAAKQAYLNAQIPTARAEQASAKRVHHLKSPAAMKTFLQAVQQETTR